MAVATLVEEFLERHRIPYHVVRHPQAFTAQEEAARAHVPGRNWAKTVVCMADEEPIQAVLPADLTLSLDRLREVVGARRLRLAREDEMAGLYPQCEVGSMPPLGPLYGQRVFVDSRLAADLEIVFDAGTHTDAIRMRFDDFVEAVKPVIGAFARLPGEVPEY